eukprot:scaffold4223_cov122-Alexandrium_tamarense.AAC.2
MEAHSQDFPRSYMKLHHQTIAVLISRDSSTDDQEAEQGASKVMELSEEKIGNINGGVSTLRGMMLLFYQGIASFYTTKRVGRYTLKATTVHSINVLRKAAEDSKWNWQNKVALLEAELFSSENNFADAKVAYNSAIALSRSSKFVHEEGLSCELAANHYKKHGDISTARQYYLQAKHCYNDWGSKVKGEMMDQKLEMMNSCMF